MTDQTNAVLDERDDMDEIELITRLLNGQLSPARAAAVKKRLKEDPAFLELAAPLLLTWSVPPYIERHPRPEGEWERAWAEFQKRTGFPQRPEAPAAAPAPKRSRWSIGRIISIAFWAFMIYVVVLSLGTIIWDDLIQPNFFPKPTDGYVAPAGPAQPTP